MAALAKYYPADFQRIVDKLHGRVPAAGDVALQNEVRPILTILIKTHRAQIDDANSVRLFSQTVAETKLLEMKDPPSCVSMFVNGTSRMDLAAALPPEVVRKDLALTADVLEQIATHPARDQPMPLSRETKTAMARQALKGLSPSEINLAAPLLIAGKRPVTDDEASAMCLFYINIGTLALQAPAGTIRSLMSAG